MIPFYRIGCVDQFPDHGRILEIFGKAFPIVSPRFDDNGILFSPLGFQTVKLSFGSLFAYSGIYPLQIGQKHLLILAANILQGVAYLMNDTQLYIGFRKDTFDGIRKALQIVYTGNKNILYTSILEIRKNAELEVRAFTFRYIHTQKVFLSVLAYS